MKKFLLLSLLLSANVFAYGDYYEAQQMRNQQEMLQQQRRMADAQEQMAQQQQHYGMGENRYNHW